jgi:hypothetical protein
LRLPGVTNQLAYILVLLADANKASIVELPSHSALAELLGNKARKRSRGRWVALELAGAIRPTSASAARCFAAHCWRACHKEHADERSGTLDADSVDSSDMRDTSLCMQMCPQAGCGLQKI